MRRVIYFFLLAGLASVVLIFDKEEAAPQAPSLENVSSENTDWKSFLSDDQNLPSESERFVQYEKITPLEIETKEACAYPVSHTKKSDSKVLDDIQNWESIPEFKEVKNIKPPVPGVLPPASSVILTPEDIHKEQLVSLQSGAYLRIPADALVMKDGSAPTKPVKISYCALNDPVDIFLSGVPMKYDSAGRSETFRTAGMFRLDARTYSGEEVTVKEGKSLHLDMPTGDTSDAYNFYTFDEDAGEWKFDYPAPPAVSILDIVLDTMNIEYNFDAILFAQKFDDPKYHFLLSPGKNRDISQAKPGRWFHGPYERTMRKALYALNYRSSNFIKLRPFNAIVGYDEDHRPIRDLRFRIYTIGNGNEFFRELNQLRNFNFSIDGLEDIRLFYKEYVRGRKYNEVRIEYSPGDEECTFLLKDAGGISRIQAKVHSGNALQLSSFAKVRFAYALKRIRNATDKKAEVHDNIIRKRKKSFVERMRWFRGWATPIFLNKQYRQLSIPGFGTYNCDQIARMKDPKPVAIRFTDENGVKLKMSGITVCDTRIRATFNFWSGKRPMVSSNGFGFVLLNTPDNKTYYLNQSAWNGARVYALKELPEIENSGQLKKLLFN
ncbi:MAG: hypothetical protein GC180_06205 [Bacteroidetes bacterium]|nr:hypothetical protein [Bacteroidota bacterium]